MRLWALLITSLLLLTSCTEAELATHVVKSVIKSSPPESQGTFKVGTPYKILGKWYRPQEDYNLVETGIASWYGPQFHGNYTANGEIFDMNELTAAHRTLQLPSIARITNLENGRSLVVRINDRGPFSRGRVLDLSRRSAELLGTIEKGTAKVRIEVLAEESMAVAEAAKRGESTNGVEVAMNDPGYVPLKNRTEALEPAAVEAVEEKVAEDDDTLPVAPLETVEVALTPDVPGHISGGAFYPDPIVKQVPVTPSNIFVQAGSFSSKENAIAHATRLGHKAAVYQADIGGKQFYRVRIRAEDVNYADKLLDELARGGNADAIIVVE